MTPTQYDAARRYLETHPPAFTAADTSLTAAVGLRELAARLEALERELSTLSAAVNKAHHALDRQAQVLADRGRLLNQIVVNLRRLETGAAPRRDVWTPEAAPQNICSAPPPARLAFPDPDPTPRHPDAKD